MTLVAASLCNRTANAGPFLLVVDSRSGETREVELGHDGIVSASGLAHDGERLYCAFTDASSSFVAVLDAGARGVRDRMCLESVQDVHSIALDADDLIAVSTGTDEVVRIDGSSGRAEVIWRASDAAADTHHLNAVTWHEGHLLCSGFGLKLGPAWSDAIDGYVYDVTAGRYVQRGIYHPHSVASFGGEVYFCESSDGTLRSQTRAIRYLPGYARGLAFLEDGSYFAASSAARRTPLEPHLFLNPAEGGKAAGTCAIHAGSLRSRDYHVIPLDASAGEIYDLLVLPSAVD